MSSSTPVFATEHGRNPTRWNIPQGIVRATERLGMNIIFVNIDWKRSRHDSDAAERRNLQQLAGTVDSIVSQLRPAVVCFCEFGEVAQPLYAAHVEVLKNEVQENWRQAVRWRNVSATEPDIQFLHTPDEPYLTAWDANQADCRHQRIRKTYFKRGEPYRAQHNTLLAHGLGTPTWTALMSLMCMPRPANPH